MRKRILGILLIAALALTLSACGGSSQPAAKPAPAPAAPAPAAPAPAPAPAKAATPDEVSLLLEWVPHGSHGPFFLGIEKGYYKEANINLAIQDGAGSVKTVQTLAGGQNTVGYASLATMAMGRGQGMQLKAVAGLMQRNVFGVFVNKGSGIKAPKDLEGKRVLVTPGSVETPLLPAFFAKNNVDAKKVTVTGVDPAAKVADYIAGKAEAMITDVPYASPTIQPKRPSDTLLWANYGLSLPAFGIFTREDVIAKNPDLMKRFVAATLKAWEYSLNNMDEAVAALDKARPGKIVKDSAKMELQLYKDFMFTDRTKGKALGWQADDDWKEALEMLKQYSELKSSTTPADYFTNQFVPSK